MPAPNMIGLPPFGRLTVVSRAPNGSHRQSRWNCICECGTPVTVSGTNLRAGTTMSCGCWHHEKVTKHGCAGRRRGQRVAPTPEYKAWYCIKGRCCTPTNIRYSEYGGRGICICRRYKTSFADFFADVGTKPTPQYTIDRINNDGHYSCGQCSECLENEWPKNIRWATKKEQGRNRRDNLILTLNDKSQPASAWAEELGCRDGLLRTRHHRGWSDEQVLTTPVRFYDH